LLTRRRQFVNARTVRSFCRCLRHSIYAADAKLGACLEIAEWRGGKRALETALLPRPIADGDRQ